LTKRPRILITRSSHQAPALADHLRALGHEPILIPTIELTEPTTFAPLDAALAQLDTFHWLLFTSANAVEAFHRRLSTHPNSVILSGAPERVKRVEGAQSKNPEGAHPATTSAHPSGDTQVPQGFSLGSHSPVEEGAGSLRLQPEVSPGVCSLPPNLCIAAIGPATARALEAIGLHADLLPPQAVAESLAEALLPHARQPNGTPTRFLLLRAEQARDILPDTLRAAGADLTIAPAYRTTIPQASLSEIQTLFSTPANYPDAITFTSSSTATNLLALLEAANLTLPPEVLRVSIGPITSQTLRDLNLPPHAEAADPTLPALVEILVKALDLNNSVQTAHFERENNF
jgi:uroporphyrinogen-III synthase